MEELYPEGNIPSEVEYTADQHIARLQLYVEGIYYSEEEQDPFRRVCCGAIAELLTNRRAYNELVEHLDARSNAKPDEYLTTWGLERVVTTAFHMEAWEKSRANYETYRKKFGTVKAWGKIGEDILRLEGISSEAAIDSLMAIRGFDLNTIKIGRRAPMEVVLKTIGKRWDNLINILDNGASRGDLLLMTAMNQPLRHIAITDTEDDKLHSDKLNHRLRMPVPPLGKKTNVDIHPISDAVFYDKWFVSNYLRFSKSQDVILRALCKRFGSIILREQNGVDHIATNFSAENFLVVQKAADPARFAESYHIVQNSFSLDQQRHTSRLRALGRMHRLLTKDGISLITGVVQSNPNDPMDPIFLDTDTAGVRTLIFDNIRPELGYQELFHWNDGECMIGQIGDGEVSKEIWEILMKNA